MDTASTTPRVAPIYWIASVLFVLLFTAFFPVMVWAGLNSPAFWTVFILLWACAAAHGRLTAEQSATVRSGLCLPAFLCVMLCLWTFVFFPAVSKSAHLDPTWRIFYGQGLITVFLAGFCAISAFVSSYKQNPS